MFAWFTGSSLKLRRLIAPLAIGLIVFGFAQAGSIERDTLPEFAPTMVEVQTEALGLSAQEVEQLVTTPLEQDLLNGVAFLEEIESASLPGLSSVVMTFEPGTDVLDARQVVNERLTQAVGAAGLPQVASLPQMIQPLSSTSRVAMVSLTSQVETPISMSVLSRWVIGPRLLGVEGVANVSIWGFRDRQLQVLVDPTELASQNIELSQIVSTAGNSLEVSPLSFLEASSPGTGGFIDTANQRLHIFHEQAITTSEELAQVPLEGPDGESIIRNGSPLTLGAVTEIVEDHQPLIGDAQCVSGPCLLLVVEKFPDQNTPQVVAGIQEALDSLAPGLPGIDVDASIYQPAELIETGLSNLWFALAFGALGVLVVLLAFVFDWRTVLVTSVTVATALGATLLVLNLAGVTVNIMIIAGLVLALVPILDDAITGTTMAHLDHHRDPGEGDRFALWRSIMTATLETRRVALYGTLVVLALLVPTLFTGGDGAAFLPSVAWGYGLGVLAGLVMAFMVAPGITMLAFEVARGSTRIGEHVSPASALGPLGAMLAERSGRIATRNAARPVSMVVALGVLILAGLIAFPFLDTTMRPDLRERDLVIALEAPPGTGLEAMSETTRQIVERIAALKGVDNVAAHVGRAVTSDQAVNVNSAAVWVGMTADVPYDETLESIQAATSELGDIQAGIRTYSDERVDRLLGRDSEGLTVRVYGDDADGLQATAERIRGSLEGITGVESAVAHTAATEETLEIEVDLDRAQAVGLKPGDVRRRAAILMSGITVGNLFEQQKVFDVVVWGRPELRSTIDDINQLQIATPGGDLIALADVADVRLVENPAVIRHESATRFVDVGLTVANGFDEETVASQINGALEAAEFTLGLHAELLGGYAKARASRTTIVLLVIGAIAAAYLLLQAAFTSWRLALMAFMGIPASLAASALAMLFFGRQLSIGGLMGAIAATGLAVRGAILLIREYQRLEKRGTPFGVELIEEGSRNRLVQVVLVGLAVVAAFLPLAMGSGATGLEIVGSMAVAVIGGAIASILFNSLVIPGIYGRWGHIANPDTSADDLFTIDIREPERVRI